MYCSRKPALLVAMAALIFTLGCGQPSSVMVHIEDGAFPLTGVTRIELQSALAGKIATTFLAPGGEILFPTTFLIDTGSGGGTLQVTAVALDKRGAELGRGTGSIKVTAGRQSRSPSSSALQLITRRQSL